MMQHQDCESQEMKPGQSFKRSFLVARQPPEACRPCKTARDYPAATGQSPFTQVIVGPITEANANTAL
jgi:hypothetical protein